jgi:hypothetical protein
MGALKVVLEEWGLMGFDRLGSYGALENGNAYL